MFLAVGDSGLIAVSSAGFNWNVRMSSVTIGFKGASYGNSTYVVVGEDGKILTCSDGSEWLLRPSGVRNDLYGVAYYNLKFSVVGTSMILYGACEAEGTSLTKSFVGVQGAVFQKSPLAAGGKESLIDNSLEMVYNENMEEFNRQKEVDSRQFDDETPHGPNQSGYFGNTTNAPSAAIPAADTLINTYYIYSYDGKLLAEYDHNGNCVKDYIYIGNRLLAEYHPQTNKYYYYMTDQINSIRIITDDNGNVVYSAAHGPYGQIQKVWTNTYEPKLKYSGKEREGYSELDYFGARYYGHNLYRFISVDPIINKKEALSDPQLWNLYSYCRNNPISFFDPYGRLSAKAIFNRKPVDDVDKIPGNNPRNPRRGKTEAEITKFKANIIQVDGEFRVEYDIEITVDAYWYYKNNHTAQHEFGHETDMENWFEGQVLRLKIIESFLRAKTRKEAKASIHRTKVRLHESLECAKVWSALKRDTVNPISYINDVLKTIF